MMTTARNTKRFLSEPKELTPNTRVLGFTASQWDEALTGHMASTLDQVKRLVDQNKGKAHIAPIGKAESGDVASTYRGLNRKKP